MPEFGESGGIASECHRLGPIAGDDVIMHRRITSERLYFNIFRCQCRHCLLNHLIRCECGPEINAACQERTEDILRIRRFQLSHVPRRPAKFRVDRKVNAFQPVDNVNESIYRTVSKLRISGMAGFSMDNDIERLGSLGCRNHLIVSRFSHDNPFSSRAVPVESLGTERPCFFSGKQQQSEIIEAFSCKLSACGPH